MSIYDGSPDTYMREGSTVFSQAKAARLDALATAHRRPE